MLALERDPTAADPLRAAFRSIHTIKGLAGFLELTDIREVSHEVETLLDQARNRQLAVTPLLIDVVLETADYLKRAISWVNARLNGETVTAPEFTTLLAKVKGALRAGTPETDASPPAEPASDERQMIVAKPVAPQPNKGASDKTGSIHAEGTHRSSRRTVPAKSWRRPESEIREFATFTVRVDAAKLDYMMDMVGELVIAQSLLAHAPELGHSEGGLQRNMQQLGRITGEVQRMAMSLRMTPVQSLYTRMTRLVRDLARKSGKLVRLELSGEETELDKTIVEPLGDPLMHMVRNSLDHGLEPPEERVSKGKPPEGVLRLAASNHAGLIVIEVSDDGRGLNTEKFSAKPARKDWSLKAAIRARTKSSTSFSSLDFRQPMWSPILAVGESAWMSCANRSRACAAVSKSNRHPIEAARFF